MKPIDDIDRLVATLNTLRCMIAELQSVLNDHQITEKRLQTQVDDLQKLLDSRPALNADVVTAYTKWTHMVYAHDMQLIRKAVKGSL
jgi:N-dimethylarginine dimethylaminohydrolase